MTHLEIKGFLLDYIIVYILTSFSNSINRVLWLQTLTAYRVVWMELLGKSPNKLTSSHQPSYMCLFRHSSHRWC